MCVLFSVYVSKDTESNKTHFITQALYLTVLKNLLIFILNLMFDYLPLILATVMRVIVSGLSADPF
jgi:hypothetical protein